MGKPRAKLCVYPLYRIFHIRQCWTLPKTATDHCIGGIINAHRSQWFPRVRLRGGMLPPSYRRRV